MSAPLFSSALIFSSAIAVETSGIFTAKVPPNPQHSSSFSQSRRLESLDVREQLARLLQHAELAPLVATAVEDGLPFEPRPEVPYAHHVDQEVRELPDAPREGLGTLALLGQLLEDERVVVGDHGGAGSGRTDYVIEALPLEDVEEVAPDGAGLVEEAGVEGGLPAAGLALGVDHLYAEPPQYAHHAYADLGVDQVHVARHE